LQRISVVNDKFCLTPPLKMMMETTMTKKVTMNRKLMILKSPFSFDMNVKINIKKQGCSLGFLYENDS